MGFGRKVVNDPFLNFGKIRLLNVPKAQEVANEVLTLDCYGLENIPDGSIVLDVGAFYGEFSLKCLIDKKCKVMAFEPSRTNFDVLRLNFLLNDSLDNSSLYNCAVGGVAGERKFFHRPDHPAGSSLLESWIPNELEIQGENVDCVTIASQIKLAKKLWGNLPVVVKLDCEGAEKEIFDNLDWIQEVNVVTMEWHNYDGDTCNYGDYYASLLEGFSTKVDGHMMFAKRN
jgi:FkbM family methyltransferase